MSLQRTALYEEHKNAGAKIVPFAGWEMPVQYSGVREEVLAVRESCGVFDVSHMGQYSLAGPNLSAALNRVVSADWSKVELGHVGYALLLNESGGVLDDVMGYHLGADEWLIVVNASRAAMDEAHLKKHLAEYSFESGYGARAMLAIQGPHAEKLLQGLFHAEGQNVELSQLQWREVRPVMLCGAAGWLARGGYTGSDGFEFMFDAEGAPPVWSTLLEVGAVPCGLGARDVLRLEAGLPLYGHELREEWTPYQSSCGWAVKMDKGDFIGRGALAGRSTPDAKIQAVKMDDNSIPREGYAVLQNGETIGEITSGTLSPTAGGIALAMLPAELKAGDAVEVQIRRQAHPARVVKKPFVALERK
jgi:aminomethyltransferase